MKNTILLLLLIVLWSSCENTVSTGDQEVYGCIDTNACNYNVEATIDDATCYYPQDWEDNCGVCDLSPSNDCLQDECGVWGGDGVDADADGICDDVDDCVGEYDCSENCNGQAIDLDEDGICDDIDDCVGEYDDCEICNGDGSSCSCDNVDCTYLDSQCTSGSCVDGECITIYSDTNTACDDGISCTINDFCDGEGTCESGMLMSCDDGNSCTEDSCDGLGGCIYNNSNGMMCDDGDQCTISDVCYEGSCSGQQMSCDDGNPCSQDSCDGSGGCIYNYSINNGMMCDDGNECTESDQCNEGTCSGTIIPDCP